MCIYPCRKLRRGDPFTEQMTDWNPPDQRERRKKLAKKSTAIEMVLISWVIFHAVYYIEIVLFNLQRRALQDVKNQR